MGSFCSLRGGVLCPFSAAPPSLLPSTLGSVLPSQCLTASSTDPTASLPPTRHCSPHLSSWERSSHLSLCHVSPYGSWPLLLAGFSPLIIFSHFDHHALYLMIKVHIWKFKIIRTHGKEKIQKLIPQEVTSG